MKFGMPTLIETENIDACAVLCKELKLDFIEINMNFPWYQTDTIDILHFQEIEKEFNLFYTIHLEEELNVCGYNKEVTEAYLKTVVKTIEIAKQLGSPIINMHLADGIYITLPEKKVYLFGQYKDLYLKKLLEFRDLCENAIGNYDLRICVENCGGFPDYAKEGIEVLLNSQVFALTFDIGHDHSSGGLDEPFIRQHKDHLLHMHIHDAIGRQNHLAIGTGEIDMRNKLMLAKECNCRCVLETKTIEGLRESVKNLHDLSVNFL